MGLLLVGPRQGHKQGRRGNGGPGGDQDCGVLGLSIGSRFSTVEVQVLSLLLASLCDLSVSATVSSGPSCLPGHCRDLLTGCASRPASQKSVPSLPSTL